MWTKETITEKILDDVIITNDDLKQMEQDGWNIKIFKSNKYKYRTDKFHLCGFMDKTILLEPVRMS